MPPDHVSRRELLKLSGTAAAVAWSPPVAAQDTQGDALTDWPDVRDLFALSKDVVHMSDMLIASHPRPVREAIERHRQALDANPAVYLQENNGRLTDAVRAAAGQYLGIHSSHIALTDSTTMGLGLVYNGLKLRQGQELLSTQEDYFVTHESLRTAAANSGAHHRQIALYESATEARADQIVERIVSEVKRQTRLLAVTWVHSSTGLKMPVAKIAAALADINAKRDEEDHVLFGVDGVHGFGVEVENFPALSCDYLMAGCHKWLFGPRGTGIAAISDKGLKALRPIIPSFTDPGVFAAWLDGGRDPPGSNDGARLSPGGFKAFEHRWALAEAFALHERLGRRAIADRTHALATKLKAGLQAINSVTVRTPQDTELSAGIVAFDIDGHSAESAVAALRERNIIASAAPYATRHVRLTPSIRNLDSEIEQAVEAVRKIV